ncbi:hypothetical protein AX018_10427 [Paracidovorax anthurii]|uniref:Uncharacterized protein n=1 Tax=Paracidovorax anthurii TaxID=78229 RepID=A0A328YVH1_9BURK|nr:hypothetical protein [Paracidovorax anthurii]RAR76825.1 hypothetical protein AX018_10427 [Paracidovorax anthurii]
MLVDPPSTPRLISERAAPIAGVRAPGTGATAAGSSSGAVDATARDTGPRGARAQDAAASGAPQPPPLRAGLSSWEPGYHRGIGHAQQALAYLADLDTQLRGLGDGVAARLQSRMPQSPSAEPTADAPAGGGDAQELQALQARIARLAQRWSERRQATGQSLDGDLNYRARGDARQGFQLAGLNATTLASGARETLFLSLGGVGRQPVPVDIDPAQPPQELARRLDVALAPQGVRAQWDEGETRLRFSVDEARWPAVRDTLAVQGGGVRYPAGQMVLARPGAEPSALDPAQWGVADAEAQRRTLRAVVAAQQKVRAGQQQVGQVLSEAASTAFASPAAEGTGAAQAGDAAAPAGLAWAQRFTVQFAGQLQQPDYRAIAAAAPALIGISRERVVALLGLPAQP